MGILQVLVRCPYGQIWIGHRGTGIGAIAGRFVAKQRLAMPAGRCRRGQGSLA